MVIMSHNDSKDDLFDYSLLWNLHFIFPNVIYCKLGHLPSIWIHLYLIVKLFHLATSLQVSGWITFHDHTTITILKANCILGPREILRMLVLALTCTKLLYVLYSNLAM